MVKIESGGCSAVFTDGAFATHGFHHPQFSISTPFLDMLCRTHLNLEQLFEYLFNMSKEVRAGSMAPGVGFEPTLRFPSRINNPVHYQSGTPEKHE